MSADDRSTLAAELEASRKRIAELEAELQNAVAALKMIGDADELIRLRKS